MLGINAAHAHRFLPWLVCAYDWSRLTFSESVRAGFAPSGTCSRLTNFGSCRSTRAIAVISMGSEAWVEFACAGKTSATQTGQASKLRLWPISPEARAWLTPALQFFSLPICALTNRVINDGEGDDVVATLEGKVGVTASGNHDVLLPIHRVG
jgi:hypothetical protein